LIREDKESRFTPGSLAPRLKLHCWEHAMCETRSTRGARDFEHRRAGFEGTKAQYLIDKKRRIARTNFFVLCSPLIEASGLSPHGSPKHATSCRWVALRR